MYFYYFMAAIGRRPGTLFAKMMTLLQITQFIVDCSMTNLWAYYHWFLGYDSSTLYISHWVGQIILWSYLFLFIQLFQDKYGPEGLAKTAIRTSIRRIDRQVFFKEFDSDFKLALPFACLIAQHFSDFDYRRHSTNSPKVIFKSCFDVLQKRGIDISVFPSPDSLSSGSTPKHTMINLVNSVVSFSKKQSKKND